MKSTQIRTSSSISRLAGLLAAAAGVLVALPSQAEDFLRPGSVYGAAAVGILEAGYECQGSPVCEHTRVGSKIFGGYRFTPSLAAEVGYYYLGSFKSTEGDGVFGADEVVDTKVRNAGVSLGFDWNNELFSVLRQHVRFGLAIVRTDGHAIYGDGRREDIKEYTTKPYLGLGLSYQFNPHVRFYSSYDVLRNKQNNHFHVLSLGVGIEN